MFIFFFPIILNDQTSYDNILELGWISWHLVIHKLCLKLSFSCVLQVYQEIKNNVRDAVITLVCFVFHCNVKNFFGYLTSALAFFSEYYELLHLLHGRLIGNAKEGKLIELC